MKSRRSVPRRDWSEASLRYLHTACARRAPVQAIANKLKRSEGSVRQQARRQGLSVGVDQRRVATHRKRAGWAKRLGL